MSHNLQSVSFVPSTRPTEDAQAIIRLTSGRFTEHESANDGRSITLIERTCIDVSFHDDANNDGEMQATKANGAHAIALLKVDDEPSKQQHVQMVPNATLILTPTELSFLQPNGDDDDDGYAVINTSPANWTLVRLGGGGSILLAISPKKLCAYATEDLLMGVEIEEEKRSEKSQHRAQLMGQEQLVDAPPYKFPSLDMSVLSDTDIVPGFTINSREGVPIESDLFVGKVLLMMRPPNSEKNDPYYHERVFSKKKRRFEIQIQGKFKYIPKGTVWVGF